MRIPPVGLREFCPLAAILLLALPALAVAQGSAEQFFIGYSFFRFEPDRAEGSDLEPEPINMHGFQIEFSRPLQGRFGLVVTASGQFRSFELGETAFGPDTDLALSHFSFLVGPSIQGFRWNRLRSTTRLLVGVSSFGVDVEEVYFEGSAFAAGLGGSFALDISDRLTWRIVQPSTLLTTFDGNAQFNTHVASGLEFRLR